MKTFIIIIILAIAGFTLTDCSKNFLETPPTTSAEPGTFATNLTSCEQLLNGSYRTMLDGFFWGLNLVYPDLTADNVKPISGAPLFSAQYNWMQVASEAVSNDNMNAYWNGYYKSIRSVALVLENVDKFRSENPVLADNIKGQALAMRAWLHFDVLNRFAQPFRFTSDAGHPGIPYVTTVDYNVAIHRGSVADTYTKIIADLTDALPLISGNPSKKYIGTYAVMALLSRVYLYKGDYLSAGKYAVNVSKQVPIMKTGYPDKLFTDMETECIFQFAPPVNPSYNNFTGTYYRGIYPYFLPTQDIVTIIRERAGDKRNAWLYSEASTWKVSKFPTGVVQGTLDPAGAHYQTLIRSSECYLTAAECFAELGKSDSAIYYLDEIRLRADPSATATTVTGPALVDLILNERRKELCFEGHRLFDVLRRGQRVMRDDAMNSGAKVLTFGSPKAIAPIPRLEVSQVGLSQNDSYQ